MDKKTSKDIEKKIVLGLDVIIWIGRIFVIGITVYASVKAIVNKQYLLLIFPFLLTFILCNNICFKNVILKIIWKLLGAILCIICAIGITKLVKS